MSELEQWVIVGLLVLLCTLVIALWDSVRDLKRAAARVESVQDDLSVRHRDKYWELRHDIDRVVTALGMHFEDTPAKRAVVKKGGPEKWP